MSQPGSGQPLFRREAVEHQDRFRGPGDLLQVEERWLSALYWTLLAAFVLAVMAVAVVRVEGRPLLQLLLPLPGHPPGAGG